MLTPKLIPSFLTIFHSLATQCSVAQSHTKASRPIAQASALWEPSRRSPRNADQFTRRSIPATNNSSIELPSFNELNLTLLCIVSLSSQQLSLCRIRLAIASNYGTVLSTATLGWAPSVGKASPHFDLASAICPMSFRILGGGCYPVVDRHAGTRHNSKNTSVDYVSN
jgi:hypothetical protein